MSALTFADYAPLSARPEDSGPDWRVASEDYGTIAYVPNPYSHLGDRDDLVEEHASLTEDAARVFAAAPDLLQAAEEAIALIDDMARFVGKMSLRDYSLFNTAPMKLRAALTKAKR